MRRIEKKKTEKSYCSSTPFKEVFLFLESECKIKETKFKNTFNNSQKPKTKK